jgi:hypothetical protein
MHWSQHREVFFVEGQVPSGVRDRPITSELNDFFSQNHLKTLDDLKDRMAQEAVASGCNAVLDFKYGQRSSFWKSIFGMDNVLWFGSGVLAKIDPTDLTG